VNTPTHCLAFRRAKLADPYRLPADAQAHLAGCPLCQAFARRIDAHEHRIARALDVPVPEGLEDRLLLGLRGRRHWPWRSLAVAASVVLSIGIGLAGLKLREPYDPARFAIEHVMHEPESFAVARLADEEEFRAVLAHFGGELMQPLGRVRYMKLCPGPEGTGWHVVLDTGRGLVTLFLIPSAKLRQPSEKTMKGYVAMVQPGGRGYYAVVAQSEPAVAAFMGQMREKVRWRT